LSLPPFAHLGDLRGQCLTATGSAPILATVDGIQLGQIPLKPLVGRRNIPGQLVAGEVASRIVHGLQPRAVHRQQLAPE